MRLLDIIVPHYNEEWNVGSKLFRMIALQRAIDFADIRVILVNDGGNRLNVVEEGFPYNVLEADIPHAGVSAARNWGIDHSDAKWVMFCDFDDCFASIYSLRSIIDVLDDENHDVLWMPFYVETGADHNRQVREKYNSIFIHGKIFRREWLIEKGLRFPESLCYSEDTAFIAVVNMEISDWKRVGKITAESPMYVWTYRKGSATTSPERVFLNATNLFKRQLWVADQHMKRGQEKEWRECLTRAVCDAYAALERTDIRTERDEFRNIVADFWNMFRDEWEKVPEKTKEIALNAAIAESATQKQFQPPKERFNEFLDGLNRSAEKERTEEVTE